MLKKLLYLYNDGHNPFPHLKGKGLHLIDGKYEYDDNPNDDKVYDQGFTAGNYIPIGDTKFLITTEEGNVFEVDRNEPIDIPNYFENQTSVYDDYDNDAEIFGNDDEDYYDDQLEAYNEEMTRLRKINHELMGEHNSSQDIQDDYNKIKREVDNLNETKNEALKEMKKIVIKETRKFDGELNKLSFTIAHHPLYDKIQQKILDTLIDKEKDFSLQTSEVISEFTKYAKMMKVNIDDLMTTIAGVFIRESKRRKADDNDVKMILTELAGIILISMTPYKTQYDRMKSNVKKLHYDYVDKVEEMKAKSSKIDIFNNNIKALDFYKKQYADRKKILDSRKKVSINKQQGELSPQDLLEIQAEQKEKEALASEKKLSKAAQKKANTAAKKAAAEKQAEAPVINAQSSLKTKGTYGKKLEDFFASNGQPILQKFTGDTSKIKDIEKDEIIPDEEVMFDDGTTNSLRKACTLDLYNNKFVFEIKNYVNNSIDDEVIPMQPSKFAGTKYFVPRYLEDGSLYSLNLNYTSPKTGKHYTQNVLPANSHGREVVFVIRLKEGLFQYKPFIDHENTKLIPTGEFASGDRPLYFFDSSKLKKCKDYNGKPAFNLKGHLTPI